MTSMPSKFVPISARLPLKVLCVITFAFLSLLASYASSETIMTVQHNSGYTATGSSLAVTFNSNVTSGNLILVAESTYDGVSLLAPTDTLGNSFTQLVTQGTTGASVAAIYAATANSSGADTVTCGVSSANNIHCHIYEVQGVTAVVDQTGSSSLASTAQTVSTSAATTNATDYVLAYFSDNHNASFYTAGTGYGDTEASEDTTGGDSGFTEDDVVTATGVQTATATATLTDTSVNVIVALETSGTLATATPTFSPAGGNFASTQTVTISDTTPSSTIYYTTDGSAPTTTSPVYSSTITVSSTETLEAIATAGSYAQSAVGSATYTFGVSGGPIMTAQHNSGANEVATSVAVAFNHNITSGNLILVAESSYHGVSLLAPTDSKGNAFTQLATAGAASGPSVAAIYAATANSSGADTVTCNINSSNNIHCHIYEVEGVLATVDKTGNSTVAGPPLTVSTSSATTNAVDYLFAFFSDNDNGATYSPGSGWGDTEQSDDGGDSGYTEDEVVIAAGVQTATATASNEDTNVNVIVALETSGTPTIPAPAINPSSGTYISVQTVYITDSDSGAVIYYTTDGSTPTTGSAIYTNPLSVSTTQTVQAIAVGAGYANSPVSSAAYIINLPAATPTFSPGAGTYATAQSVTISDATPDSTIYYTTNGYAPSTSSAIYSTPIPVTAWETVEAIATAPGSSVSAVGIAPYTIGNPEAAAPTFSPAAGTYASTQTVTIGDATSGATVYYTTDGTTPTTDSAVYSTAISVSASGTLEAIATAGGYVQSGVALAPYTINSTSGACSGMSVGSSVAGTANMNGFVPFQGASNITNLWDTNIANAAVDPNNALIQSTGGYAGEATHVNFGANPGDGGIPFMIVDSGQNPNKASINVIDYPSNSDVVVAPFPNNVPIEGNFTDCSGWPDTYQSDAHANVLDRNTCWDYETYNTNRCDGLYDASGEVIWDMQNGEMRPWGWTSTDAAGLSVMAGLVKYDEAASGHINHAIRFTMQQSKDDANDGYFVEPASHAAGTTYGAPTVEGMRVRLKASFNISGYSAINQAILTAMQQYGMIMADNGGYFFIQGATDPRWNDSDLTHLAGIPSSDFDVIDGTPSSTTMTPAYPGWDSVTAPTGAQPVINSFTASPQTVSAGTPVTFNISVSGDSYDYIDMIGPVRLTQNGGGSGINTGSVTIYPTATQTYTLYTVNQYGNNGVGAGYGVTPSTPITIVVPGSVVVPPTFTPQAGAYTTAQQVTFNTTTYPFASFYYTTDGSTPTYPPTGTTQEYPQIPQPQSSQGSGNPEYITISTNETVNAIAVAPGYSSASAVSSATYEIGPITATPTFSPAAGNYGLAQTVTISDSTGGATIYYATDGSTPTTASSVYATPLTVSSNETLEAFATSASANNSPVASATYTIGGTAATPSFSPVGGNYVGNQSVTISDTSSGATIYYTTNGSTPTTGSTAYSSPVTITTSETLQAIAAGSGYTNSAVASTAFTILDATPGFSPATGSYVGAQTVTISDASSGATIYYTTNGSTPSTNSAVYSSPITVSATETLEALAAGGGNNNSGVGSAAYTIAATTPTFSPTAGNYGVALTVTISDTTPSSTIYYTTDGSTPNTGSAVYSTPVTVSATETLQAIATAVGDNNSSVGSTAYTITIGGQASTPTFSLGTGSYIGTQTVTISDTSIGATIYYTLTPGTSGTTPTTASTVYTGPVNVPSTSVLEAIAVGGGFTASEVDSAAYNITITAAFVQQCNEYKAGGVSGASATCTLNGVTAGDALMIGIWTPEATLSSVTSSTTAQPVSVIPNYNAEGTYGYLSAYLLPSAPAGNITITASETGYYVGDWVTVAEYTNVPASPLDTSGTGSSGNSDYGASNVDSSDFTTTANYDMLWSICSGEYAVWTAGTAPIAWTQLMYAENANEGLSVEDGVAGAAGMYYGQCYKSNGGYDQGIVSVALLSSAPVAATPTFSPTAGTYTTDQTVTISDSTSGATIYYTTDGTTPATSSAVYSAPISISASETLNAIAAAAGYGNSTIASAAYLIGTPAATPTFSPVAGTYSSAQSVTISDSTGGATIYYTTDGTTPTTSSPAYSAPVSVSASETLSAIAVANSYLNSSAGSAAYTISLPSAALPTFSPAAGTYTSSQSVTISDTTPSSAIYYTTDGSTPTYPVTGTTQLYSATITVSASETVNAIAVAAGYSTSAEGTVVYTISPPVTWPFMDSFNRSDCTSSCGLGGDLGPNYTQFVTPSTLASGSLELSSNTVTMTAWSGTYGSVMSGAVLTEPGYTFIANQYAQATLSSDSGPIYLIVHYADANDYNYVFIGSGGGQLFTVTGGVASWVSDFAGGGTVGHVYRLQVIGDAYTLYDNGSGYNGTSDGTITTSVNPSAGSTGIGIGGYQAAPGAVTNFQTNNCTTTCPADAPAATPTFSPVAGTYSSGQSVTISDSTGSSTIYYTTDGTTPTTGSAVYSTPITVSTTETLSAMAVASDYLNSALSTAAYTIETPAATPIFSPVAGSYTSAQTVTISDSTGGASIYYTTNGTTPTTGSSLYSTPISISTSQTLEAIAVASGYNSSTAQSGIYAVIPPAAMPTFSPGAGSYSTVQTVTISDATGGATIYYTTNGTTPTTSSATYSGPITVPSPETLEAVAIASGYSLSSPESAAYTYPAPSSGATYVQQCNNYASGYTSGASANCTLTGVTAGDTLVIGVWTTDATLSSVTASTTEQPVAEISNYSSTQEYYSNGYSSAYILPNAAAGSITVTANETGYYASDFITVVEFTGVAASPYDVQGTGTLHSYGANVYATTSTYNTTAANDMLWTMCEYSAGTTLAIGNAPVTWTSATNLTISGANILTEYGSAGASGTYYGDCEKTVSGYGPDIISLALKNSGPPAASTPTFSPTAGSYATAQTVTISTTTPSATIYYTTDGSTPTTSSTTYSAPISVTGWKTVNAITVASGYANSAVGSAAYNIGVATPTFSPGAGSYTSIQTVTISDATSSSSIYYTTNGTTPSTGSTLYSTPITVSATETVEAIGVKTSYANSAIASATYTLQLPQTITFTPSSPVIYGVSPITLSATGGDSGNPVTFTYVSGPGTLSGTNNDILTVTGTGTVYVTANQAGNSSYAVATSVPADIVVNPAALTVTANNQSKAVGAVNPTLTASYSGFVNGDGTGVLSGAPSLSTTATTSSAAGTYPITVTQGTLSAANYTFAYVNGTLSVIAAPTVIITTTATVTGSHSGGYSVAVKVTNSGTGAASNVTLTSATLGTTAGSPVPQSVATLGAGDSYTFTVTVPGSAGTDGAGVAEKYAGTYTGGSFSASVRSVTLP